MILGLVGAALVGLMVWKVTDLENDIRELSSRIEELEKPGEQ